MVDAGLVSEDRIQAIFMTGFEAFAVGKFAVVPATLLLGVRCRPRPGGAGTGVADALDCAKRVPSNTDGGPCSGWERSGAGVVTRLASTLHAGATLAANAARSDDAVDGCVPRAAR